VQWALLFNALSYVVSFAAIRSVPSRSPEATPNRQRHGQSGLRAEFVAGLRFFRGNKTLMTLLPVAMIAQCGVAPLETLNVFFVTRNLHASTHLYGYLGMALGVGGVIGALCTGPLVRRYGARAVAWAGISLLGVLLVVYSRQTVFAAGLVLLFLLALPMAMASTALAPLLLEAAPREYVGGLGGQCALIRSSAESSRSDPDLIQAAGHSGGRGGTSANRGQVSGGGLLNQVGRPAGPVHQEAGGEVLGPGPQRGVCVCGLEDRRAGVP